MNVNGGRAVHYRCDESSDWYPDIADITAKVTARTRAIVIINPPNNPTGAVYPPEVLTGILDIAREHNLIVCSDEIYDKILFDDAVHITTASLAPDLLCLTFNGLSKAYRCAGFRAGWLAVSGPTDHAVSYLDGLTTVAGLRRCANAPAQQAIRIALEADRSGHDLTLPAGLLQDQRDRAWAALNSIPGGVSCVKPRGARCTRSPRSTSTCIRSATTSSSFWTCCCRRRFTSSPGTGLSWPEPDHVRIVTLPSAEELETTIASIGGFLATYRQ